MPASLFYYHQVVFPRAFFSRAVIYTGIWSSLAISTDFVSSRLVCSITRFDTEYHKASAICFDYTKKIHLQENENCPKLVWNANNNNSWSNYFDPIPFGGCFLFLTRSPPQRRMRYAFNDASGKRAHINHYLSHEMSFGEPLLLAKRKHLSRLLPKMRNNLSVERRDDSLRNRIEFSNTLQSLRGKCIYVAV